MVTRIDRLSIVQPIEKAVFVKSEQRLRILAKTYGVQAKKLQKGLGYRAVIPLSTSDKTIRVSVESHYGRRFVKYDFKPNDFSSAEIVTFNEASTIFGQPSLRNSIQLGNVSYVELAIDYVGVIPADILYFNPYSRPSAYGPDVLHGGYYLGSRRSRRRFHVYNRSKHPQANPLEIAWSPLMRVEARLRDCKLRPIDLGKLKNPFLSLRIVDQKLLAQSIPKAPGLAMALEACRTLGSPRAFKVFPEWKHAILEAAKTSQVSWWRPHLAMKKWPDMVQSQLRFKLLDLLDASTTTTFAPSLPPLSVQAAAE